MHKRLLLIGLVLEVVAGCGDPSGTEPIVDQDPPPRMDGAELDAATASGGAGTAAQRSEIELSGVIDPTQNDPYPGSDPYQEPELEFETLRDLAEDLPVGARLVGISRDPDGLLYVLEATTGIYEVTSEDLLHVYGPGDIAIDDGLEPAGSFSDLVALGNRRFALTAPNEGYMVDVPDGHMWRHFCYFPRVDYFTSLEETSISVSLTLEGKSVWQGTDSLTLDRQTGLLWATPRTFGTDDDQVFGSELASFDLATGTPTTWSLFDQLNIEIGGMAIQNGTFVFGADATLYLVSQSNRQLLGVFDASPSLGTVSGLSAETDGSFLVTDQGDLVVRRLIIAGGR